MDTLKPPIGTIICIMVLAFPCISRAQAEPASAGTSAHASLVEPAILVNGNEELARVPGITGNGSGVDQFVNEGKNVNAGGSGSSIHLQNVDACLIIRDCMVSGSGPGYHDAGIRVERSHNITIIDNKAVGNAGSGILVQFSSGILISRNNVSGNDVVGIFVHASSGVLVAGNNATSNHGSGIYMDRSWMVNVSRNIVSLQAFHGISSFMTTNVIIMENEVSSNGFNGIHVSSSSNITVIENIIRYNGVQDIVINDHEGNVVHDNQTPPGRVTSAFVSRGRGVHVLTWHPPPARPGLPITGYHVYWSRENGSFTRVALGNITSFRHERVHAGTKYHYIITAENAIGVGKNSSTFIVHHERDLVFDIIMIVGSITCIVAGLVAFASVSRARRGKQDAGTHGEPPPDEATRGSTSGGNNQEPGEKTMMDEKNDTTTKQILAR